MMVSLDWAKERVSRIQNSYRVSCRSLILDYISQNSMGPAYDASNRTLSKVLISMPKLKLDKIYEMKLKAFQSIKD